MTDILLEDADLEPGSSDASDGTPETFESSPLGDRLVAAGLLSLADLERCVPAASRSSTSLGDYVVSQGLLSRSELYEHVCALQRKIEVSSFRDLPEWDTILNDVGQPLGEKEPPHGTLLLGLNEDLAAGLRRFFVLSTQTEQTTNRHAALLARVMEQGFSSRGRLCAADPSVLDVVMSEWRQRGAVPEHATGATTSEIHAQWDQIILEALRVGASDIHLTATMGRGDIHFRVLGELEPRNYSLTEESALELAASMYNTMVDKGSTKSGFNPRIPQDGVVSRTYAEGALRLRYSGLPVEPTGVNVTLRLIPMGVTAKAKLPAELGYSPDQSDALERIFSRSSGLVLFLGTTGSGKSTSMANMLMNLVKERPGKKLRTVEEPVEIRIPGASQTSVLRSTKDAGDGAVNEFVAVMAALMRSDPDYLMVGEIRDGATASLAVQAVRSGHLCVSTLHADGAPIAYDRLNGLGVSRTDMASVGLVAGLIYQRLVPVLCDGCKIPAEQIAQSDGGEHARLLQRLGRYLDGQPSEGIFFRNPLGCDECKKRGIVGRTVCAEILVPRAGMLQSVRDGDSSGLWRQWRAAIDPTRPEHMEGRTAFEHALWKMRQGICSPVDVEKEFQFLDEPVFS